MARIRSIKPEFWEDEKIGKLSIPARLLFIGLWNFCDDYGVIVNNIVILKTRFFAYDENLKISEIKKWIDELLKAGLIIEFKYNELKYLIIINLRKHQLTNSQYTKKIVPHEIRENALKNALKIHSKYIVETQYIHSTNIVYTHTDMDMDMDMDKDMDMDMDMDYIHVNKKLLTTESFTFLKEFWNEKLKDFVPEISDLSKNRINKIKSRIKSDKDFIEKFKKCVDIIAENDFLKGKNNTGWKINFDWLVENDVNYLKVYEGNYTNQNKVLGDIKNMNNLDTFLKTL